MPEDKPSAPDQAVSERIPPLAGINSEAGIRRMGDNIERYRKMLSQFRLKQAGTVDKIERALASGEREQAERQARILKGFAGNIGADDLHHASSQLEAAINADQAVTGEALGAVRAALTVVIEAIADMEGEA